MESQLSFDLSQDEKILQESVRKFVQAEFIPIAAEFDRSGDFPAKVIAKAADLGFLYTCMPESVGGLGLSNLAGCLVVEELAYGCAGITTSCVANDLALLPIVIGGTGEQHAAFVAPIVESKKMVSFCLSEPGAGSDAAGISTKLEKTDGGYFLTGNKQWITNGGVAEQYTVFATLDSSARHKGICCLVVPAQSEGISTGDHEDKLGQRASNTTTVSFDKVFVPEANLIGKEGEGFQIAMKTLDRTRPFTAIMAVGIARRAFECARDYAKERKQFGKAISEFQGIQFMLADMYTELEAARLLTYQSAYLADQGRRNSLESSMAKRYSADVTMKITTDAVQIYGGYGYTKDYPVEKLMRDAKLMQIYEGTSQIQKLVIGRELLS